MGCYVNPPSGEDKLAWLFNNGKPTNVPKLTQESVPVCLVDNGMFMAAGVGFSQAEVAVFADPDGRDKMWFQVPREKLYEVSDLKNWER